jgi:hypothetical protein
VPASVQSSVPAHISLFFPQAKHLTDPAKRLQGSGSVAKHVVTPEVLDELEIRALLSIAKGHAKVLIDPEQNPKLIIKSMAKNQQPRRPEV